MLTEKDYCDYKLVLELKELGYDYTRREGLIHLYDAQKWLRGEKKIDIFVRAGYLGKNRVRHYYVEVFTSKDVIYLDNDREDYDSYEEALLEGIKESVKLLKEE